VNTEFPTPVGHNVARRVVHAESKDSMTKKIGMPSQKIP
jgi:hypothetical protein